MSVLNEKELLSLYEQEQNKSAVAREYCKNHNIEYNDSVRRRVSYIISSNIDPDSLVTTKTTTSKNDCNLEVFVLSAFCIFVYINIL